MGNELTSGNHRVQQLSENSLAGYPANRKRAKHALQLKSTGIAVNCVI